MFDELKIKSLLKKDLSKESFSKLSDKIKRDKRVISHLLKCDPAGINLLDVHTLKEFLLDDYSLVFSLSDDNLNRFFMYLDLSKLEINTDVFNKLNNNNRNKVLNHSVDLYFELLPTEDRVKELSRCISDYYYAKFMNQEFAISIDSLNKIVLNLTADELVEILKYNEYVVKHIADIVKEYDFDKLLELYNEKKEVIEFFDDVSKSKISIIECNGNLDEIIKLDVDTQIMYFKYNINELRYASGDVVERFLNEYDKLDSSILIKLGYAHFSMYVSLLSKEEQMKIFSYDFSNVYSCTNGYKASFTLDNIMYDKLCKINDVEKRKSLLSFYKTLEEEKINERDPYIYHNQKYQLSRMIYDDNIVNNNSVEILEKYRDTYDRKILIEILSNAYGEHVLEIFNSRPYLNLFDVDNFKIFDKKIYDKLGSGFIHYLLNCDMGYLNNIIGKLVEDNDLFDKFSQYFNCITSDKKDLDINIITNLINKFMIHEEVLKNIDYSNLTDLQKRNLDLFIRDDDDLTICVQNIEDLDNYIDLRRNRFIEIGRSITSRDDMKDLIFSYVTGRSVENNDMVLETLTLESAINVFNIDNIINNEELVLKMGLSKDEVSILLLLHEVNKIYDLNVLKNTFEALVNRNLDSVLFMNTFNKIKDYYIDDVKKGLLSQDKINSLPKETVDGVEVINFDGDDFTLICSVNGLDLSDCNSFGTVRIGKDLLSDWINRENGFNIISTALVSSDTEIYPVDKKIFDQLDSNMIFVFDSDIDIIGMGGSDISSEHRKRSKVHFFEYIGVGDHDNGFSTMAELKDRINENRNKSNQASKFNSEITIARKEEDVRKENSGARVMPVALYVIGDIKEEHIKTAKIFNEYYEANGLGKFRIIRVDPLIYKGEGRKAISDNEEYAIRR